MNISGTFLKSKISQRIAILLLLAATIPTLLITGLTYHTIKQLITDHDHKSLVDTSQNYALSTFANLKFARTTLQQFSNSMHNDSWQLLNLEKSTTFRSIVQISTNGNILNQYGVSTLSLKMRQDILTNIAGHQARLMILESSNTNQDPVINLVMPRINNGQVESILIAQINPDYLWGEKSDYPSSINACVHQISADKKTRLFCSNNAVTAQNNSNTQMNDFGAWELFLHAEFYNDPWIFETNRLYSATTKGLWNFIGSNSYIGITMLSLLMVGLLSLIQIRRTMVPLENLIDGTRRISKGHFAPIKVDGKSEFSELTNAFNNMSSDIKRQLDTLQSLSTIDRELISKLDIEKLADQVINRIQQLKPGVSISIFRLSEKTEAEVQCVVNISQNETLSSTRIAFCINEISRIKSYGQGHFYSCSPHSTDVHERLMFKMGANHIWTLPIFWQGELCAFLCIGSETDFDQINDDWNEISVLASRIGIAISAQQREERLLIQAQYDILTGLPNRILLQDRLNQAIELSERTGDPVWVMFLDLDRFKYVNDSLGHHAGDDFLVQISQRLQTEIRETDTVARFGGDEFIIILHGKMDENLRMGILNRLINSVAMPIKIEEQELIITCSVGISIYPNDGATTDQLIKHADMAMYRAKELGKNNFQFFTQAMNEKVTKHLHMENLLHKALDRNELILHYQPKVDLISMQIVGMEALIRWNSEELGLISPVQFIALSEETGLILPIGEWILRTACKQAVAWEKAGYQDLLMSVNVSARQFKQNNLVDSIQSILNETGLKAEQLELELTESMIMNEIDVSFAVLAKIKSLGIKLSVDDFGTGYSSLSYLKNLPLDTLKIDKSFIDDIVLRTDNAPIVETIITLAKNLNLKVVAEGVESFEQVSYLTAHGCNQIQGYYFSKPECAESIEKKLIEFKNKTLKI